MSKFEIHLEGEEALRQAINRQPEYVKRRGLQMMTRLKAIYQQRINRKPWQVGGGGGGVPRDTNSLAHAHRYQIRPTQMKISLQGQKEKKYGWYVHEGTRKMKERPWLDYAHEKEKNQRDRQVTDFLRDITNNLGD